ncbi:MAG: AI-2E family transporter [Acidobacteriaceae bacterium]|nr:AI-2E family transporter [Acidobacteriaceae bacterium]
MGALYFGGKVTIPFALALLFTFLLTPPVRLAEKTRIGRLPSVVIVMILAFSAFGALVWVGAEEFAGILIELPHYQANIQTKLDKLTKPGASRVSKGIATIQTLANELSPDALTQPNQTRRQPVPVEIVPSRPGAMDSLSWLGGSVAGALATAGAVIIFTLFMLLKRVELRNRLFTLFGISRIGVVTAAMDDAAKRVSSYLLTLLMVNSIYGLLLGVGLYLIGVPYAIFWGVLAVFIRFVPYVGTLIVATCPFVLSLAVFDGWRRPVLVLGLWAIIEGAISGMLEPLLYASRAGISSLAILISAIFWTILWGPIGLVLSTPLTVCLVVLGRHVPQLEFLSILMGEEPELAPQARYYERLLASNEEEARAVIEQCAKERTLLEVYDSVLIPALSLAEQDRYQGTLDDEQHRIVCQATGDLLEDIGGETEDLEAKSASPASPLSILCIPARDEADELAGVMLTQAVRTGGYNIKTLPAGYVGDALAAVMRERPKVLIISALQPFAISRVRSICRRARQRIKDLKIIVGLWNAESGFEALQTRLGTGCPDYIVGSLAQAELQLKLLADQSAEGRSEGSKPQQPQAVS